MTAESPVDSQIRSMAPRLELADEQGRVFSLASLRGDPVLVSFLSHAA